MTHRMGMTLTCKMRWAFSIFFYPPYNRRPQGRYSNAFFDITCTRSNVTSLMKTTFVYYCLTEFLVRRIIDLMIVRRVGQALRSSQLQRMPILDLRHAVECRNALQPVVTEAYFDIACIKFYKPCSKLMMHLWNFC